MVHLLGLEPDYSLTQSKEYAELEWPLDILIAVVWIAYMFNFIMTLSIRKVSHMLPTGSSWQ